MRTCIHEGQLRALFTGKQKTMVRVNNRATPDNHNALRNQTPLSEKNRLIMHVSSRPLFPISKGGRYGSRRCLDGAQLRSTPALSTLPAGDVEPKGCRRLVRCLLGVVGGIAETCEKTPFLGLGLVIETDFFKGFLFHAIGPFETGRSHGRGVDAAEAGVQGCPGGHGFGVYHWGPRRDVLLEISMAV